ncbi:MAG: DNA methyltransferase [Phaeospirillum sp.]|nr:DNA methyltransferase [Phaeospirillum sp.]
MLNRDGIEAELGLLEAETWPPRHNVHKYWGKKPANVVRSYIEYFSAAGDTVLDPFCGSGVTPIEAALLGRRAIGFDFNPFAVALGQALATPPDPREFKHAAAAILKAVEPEIADLFHTRCRDCGRPVVVRSFGYDGDRLAAVRYRCACTRKSCDVAPDDDDIQLAARVIDPVPGTPDADIMFGWEMRKLKSIRRWSQLFTPRNYRIAGAIRAEIQKYGSSPALHGWLSLTLTAGLAQFTRMIADSSGAGGGPSWKINSYWMPEKWQELNPHWYFENRAAKSLTGIVDLFHRPIAERADIRQCDSRSLPLADHSVDYIFTDPPYGGEGIQYGELSMLWNLWLGTEAPLPREIAFNPVRKLSAEHYGDGLSAVFAEAARVLRPERWLTVTFANKTPEVWDALMGACRNAGFQLVTAAPMKRSAPSLTETTMRQAPKADLILSFRKGRRRAASRAPSDRYLLPRRVEKIVTAMRAAGRPVTASTVFDRVTIDWFSWFYDGGDRPETVTPTLDEVEKTLTALGVEPPVSKEE